MRFALAIVLAAAVAVVVVLRDPSGRRRHVRSVLAILLFAAIVALVVVRRDPSRRRHPVRSGLAIVLVAAVATVVVLRDPSGNGDAYRLVEQVVIYDVNDAGVGDLDGDGRPDRWTTNHSAMPWIDLGGRDGTPGSDVETLALWNDRTVPALESSARPVRGDRPGRIWFEENDLVIAGRGLGSDRVEGSVDFPWELTGESSGDASVSLDTCERPDDVPCWRATFLVGDGGTVRVRTVPPRSNGFPITFAFDPGTDLDDVQLGSSGVPPPARNFTWRSRDRHGLAIATLGGETTPSLFFSRGGARGRLDEVDPGALDELFEWRDGQLEDRTAERGIVKDSCPGRQVAWQDVDGDGLLDLYIVCGRGSSEAVGGRVPNQLHLQQADGTFEESATELGLDLDDAGSFRFLRVGDGCGELALLNVSEASIELHTRRDGVFSPLWSVFRSGGAEDQLVVGDLDVDGVWDAIVFSDAGNAAFEVELSGPVMHDLEALGLPAMSLAGAVGDVDGDGWPDVVAAPQGVFRGDGDGFAPTDDVDFGWAPTWSSMRLALLDHDGDGDLDLWALSRQANLLPGPLLDVYRRLPERISTPALGVVGREAVRSMYWGSRLFENILDPSSAVEIDITGPARNPDAIGAVVEVGIVGEGAAERHVRLFPGIAESSLQSQTNHDLRVHLAPGTEVGDLAVHCVDATAMVEPITW